MKRHFTTAAFAAAILLSGVSFVALMAPASAQDDGSVSFDTFHDQLAAYGDWVYSDRWGEVWIPDNVPDDFRPYDTNGYWADTDEYGWVWASNYEWGDIPFHYGRWVNDPEDGWLWIPGYVWSPGWVIWRSNGQYTGWMAMPPDPEFLGVGNPSFGISFGDGIGVAIDFNNTGDYYGYSQWYGPSYSQDSFAANWVFIGTGHMGDHDYRRYEAPRGNYVSIIQNTKNITNYTVVNNYIVNKSVDVNVVQRASGHPVQAVHVADVIKKPQFISRADTGRQVQTRMRTEMPRGTGLANSAPKPDAKVVQSLSTKVTPHNGHPAAHLYTRNTVATAPLVTKPAGPSTTPGKGTTTPSTTTPSNETPAERDRRMHTNSIPSPQTPGTTPETTGPGNETPAERDRRMHPNNGTPSQTPATTPETGGPNGNNPDTIRRRGNETVPSNSAPSTPGNNPPRPLDRRVQPNPNGATDQNATPGTTNENAPRRSFNSQPSNTQSPAVTPNGPVRHTEATPVPPPKPADTGKPDKEDKPKRPDSTPQ